VVALEPTQLASIRRRRRNLALPRTLGFTGRQLAASVVWQSSLTVGMGTLFGVTLRIVAGWSFWDLFAQIDLIPRPR